jgi:hypothetical protein
VELGVAERRVEFRDLNLPRRIGDAGHAVGPLERAAERVGVGVLGSRIVAHAVAHPIGFRRMANAGDPDGIEVVVADEALRGQHHRATAGRLRAAIQQLDRPRNITRRHHLIDRHHLAQMRVGCERGVAAVLHRDPRHVEFGHAVAVHVAHRGHRQHVDGAERQRTFVAGIPDLVQYGLRVTALAHLVRAGGQHDVARARHHMVISRGYRGDAGGAPCVDAQEGFAAAANGIDAEPFGIADPHHRIGRQRIDHRLDRIELELGILHRQQHGLAHQVRVAGIVAARAECRLADADDADAIAGHARASRPSTIAA